MKPEDVPDEWVAAARVAGNNAPWGDIYRYALAAVAPLVAMAERDTCAAMVDDYQRKLADMSGTVPGVVEAACVTIATAIRARGGKP